MKKIQDSLKGLTPQQRLEFLETTLEKEKNNKNKKQILTLIKETKKEQTLLEETIRQFESRKPLEEEKAEPLETMVEEEVAAQIQTKKQEQPGQLYGLQPTQSKPEDMYGAEKIQTKYISPERRKDSEYKSQPEFPSGARLTREEENLINTESHRLEKEKKKYETGVS